MDLISISTDFDCVAVKYSVKVIGRSVLFGLFKRQFNFYYMTRYMFRGKRKDNNQWTYGSFMNDIDQCMIYVYGTGEMRRVFSETIGQNTGLKDKNGKDIYEGDLIRFAEKYLYLVKFEDAKFVGYHANNDWGKWGDLYMLGEVGFTKYNYVVIGNVHDNAELLTPAEGAVNYNMNNNFDPGTKAEEATNKQESAAAELAAQDTATGATESAEEGSTEG